MITFDFDCSYATLITSMEEALAGQGHKATEFEQPTLFQKPYRSHFLTRVARSLAAAGSPPRTVCETGFGAGHSSMLWISLSMGDAKVLPHPIHIHTFDHGLSKYSIPAHDYIDERWPDNLYLYLGDSYVTVPQMADYYPEARCDVVYIDGSLTYDTVSADLRNFRDRAAPGAVVALAGAKQGTEALRAWTEASGPTMTRTDGKQAGGLLVWEGTVLEVQQQPETSDALVYGRYR